MAQENVVISFIGQKISKLQWCIDTNGSLSTNEFITGSCDDSASLITRWMLPKDVTENGNSSEPVELCKYQVNGSVTDLVSMTPDRLVCSSSSGDVSIIQHDKNTSEMSCLQSWRKLHQYKNTNECATCTCVITQGAEIITGGEDGSINILTVDRLKPVQSIQQADSSNITGLQYLSNREIVSINTTGQLKLWDIRSQELTKPEKVMTLSGNTCPLLSVDKHPNQPHILVTGHGDGVIGIWDIRQEKSPVTLIDAHDSEVWQVRFHPLYPDNLFTCSQDGSCWFWDGTSMLSGANIIKTLNETTQPDRISDPFNQTLSSSIWLYIDANKHKMETFSLIPFNKSAVNCFDVNMSSLICATDSEALIIVQDIPIKS